MNLAANAYDSYEDDEAADAYDSENEDEVLVAYEIYKQDEGFLGDDNHDHSRVNVELSKDEPCDDDDADEDTQSLPDSLGSNDAYHEEPYPPRHKSPNYRQEVQRYIPSAYDAELKWQDQNYHYWPGVHHFNWWGQPVFHRSPSLPEESLAVLHATPKSFDDDDDLTKWVLLKNAQRGLDPVVVDRVDKKAYNDLMTLRGSALQHAAKGRVWRAYSEYGSWRFDGEDENELNAPDFAEMTLNLSPGVKVINGFLENGYARSRKGYICRLERDRKINADTATNSRWAPLEESEAAGRVYIKRRDWIPETRSPLQKVETLSPLQTPGPFETWSALETASPIETLNSIETSSSLETSSVLELPATTSPLQKVETPDILEKLGQIEMASILETSSVLEIPATRSPLQKVETPDILENLGQIQTQSALDTTSPIETSNPMETSSSLETLSALEILEVRSPLQKVETPDILENLGQIQTPSALETSSALNTPPKRTLRRTAKQQQLRPTPLPALGQPKKLGKTAGKASANATTGPVDTSRDPDIYFSFPTPKIKKKNKIKRFFVKTWQVFRDGLSPKE
ncbi:hypothetical protein N7466_008318 [Penicillium verhagenii]|uniref:uncharacterized protein n=1 Tax=Penicillium verhagenii TaxID=1562060 RepID=UPI00254538C5|nr:uncharacterized protein N7466_008318 [Penicillium verhagenii]KAJ5924131.1 hypothetical protein N7466_008318 [Penicillium verhagenii]